MKITKKIPKKIKSKIGKTEPDVPATTGANSDGDESTVATLSEEIQKKIAPRRRAKVPYRTIVATIWLLIGSGLLLLLVFALRKVIFFLVLASFLALVLNPGVRRLQRMRMRRGFAIAVVVAAALFASIGIGATLGASLASEGVDLASKAPTYLKQAETGQGPFFRLARRVHLEGQLSKAGPEISKTVSRLPKAILSFLRSVASATLSAGIVVVLAIFMLVEGPSLIEGVIKAVPDDLEESTKRIGHATSVLVSGYTTGALLLAALNGIFAAIALGVMGVPFVLPLAIWAGLIDVLPIIGGFLAFVPAALFAFAHSTAAGIVVVVTMGVYQQLKNHVLYPVFIGRAVKLNPLLVLLAVLVGTELSGVMGALLAIPIAGSIQAVVVEVARSLRNEELLPEDEGAGLTTHADLGN